MVQLEQLAAAALAQDALKLRSLVQDWLREHPDLTDCPRPQTSDLELLTVAAALVELFAQRAGQDAPAWTALVGPLSQPRYLVRSAQTMQRLRRMCRQDSPDPLRRRNLFAPADFLAFA